MEKPAKLNYRWKVVSRYLLAILTVAIALLVRQVLAPSLFETARYTPFFFAVAVTALLGGMRPGLVATALSVVLTAFFVLPPVNSFWIDSADDRLQLLLFTVMAGGICWLSGSVYKAQRRAAAHATDKRERQARYTVAVREPTLVDG